MKCKCNAIFNPLENAAIGSADGDCVEVRTRCPKCGQSYYTFTFRENWVLHEGVVEDVGDGYPDERSCIVCGCTDSHGCRGGCSWTLKLDEHTGVCSKCVLKVKGGAITIETHHECEKHRAWIKGNRHFKASSTCSTAGAARNVAVRFFFGTPKHHEFPTNCQALRISRAGTNTYLAEYDPKAVAPNNS